MSDDMFAIIFYLSGAILGVPAALYSHRLVDKQYPNIPHETDTFLVLLTAGLSWPGLMGVMFFILTFKRGK